MDATWLDRSILIDGKQAKFLKMLLYYCFKKYYQNEKLDRKIENLQNLFSETWIMPGLSSMWDTRDTR